MESYYACCLLVVQNVLVHSLVRNGLYAMVWTISSQSPHHGRRQGYATGYNVANGRK